MWDRWNTTGTYTPLVENILSIKFLFSFLPFNIFFSSGGLEKSCSLLVLPHTLLSIGRTRRLIKTSTYQHTKHGSATHHHYGNNQSISVTPVSGQL